MNYIIKFICKWLIPIGFLEFTPKINEVIFSVDGVGKQTYWRVFDARNKSVDTNNKNKGAGILLRRS